VDVSGGGEGGEKMEDKKRSSCPIAGTLDIIGDRWTLLIIRDMHFMGKQRFEEFLESPEKISTNILADRLKNLELMGLVEKQPYSNHSRRMNYILTERGQALAPILKFMVSWGLKNISGTQIPGETFRNRDFQIRDAVISDRETLVRFMINLQEYERSLHPSRSHGKIIGDDHLGYLENIVKQLEGRILVAESNQQLFGFIVCFIEEMEEGDKHIIEEQRRFGYISDLYVLPEGRGQGIGKALVKQAENHFHNLGLFSVKISFLHNNYQAEKLYYRLGYQPYENIYEKRLIANC
jgi:DNA-binding HxlR family transcriptional regulator/GNAT superfamily N-acetyltransferase